MWGQLKQAVVARPESYRFTPTRVGTTLSGATWQLLGGSPPRVWGQLSGDGAATVRFTPTRVGTTDCKAARYLLDGSPPRVWGQRHIVLVTRSLVLPVHPHACGDNVMMTE